MEKPPFLFFFFVATGQLLTNAKSTIRFHGRSFRGHPHTDQVPVHQVTIEVLRFTIRGVWKRRFV